MTTENPQVFAFERDFAASLRCIPMLVRFKLDRCRVKLSLRQWHRFSLKERETLLSTACGAAAEVEHYRALVVDAITARTKERAQITAPEQSPCWNDRTHVPDVLVAQVWSKGLKPPSLDQWAELSDLQRFALLKLTRRGHHNANFVPAMHEFGLVATEAESKALTP